MSGEIYLIIGETMAQAGVIALFMTLLAKLINILLKALTRGEIVV